MSVFDFVNAITFTKEDLIKDNPDRATEYIPFIVNKALSYYPDTIQQANLMNIHSAIPKEWQFDFLKRSISKKKRFTPWIKPLPDNDDIAAIQEYHKYSRRLALEVFEYLSVDHIMMIKEKLKKGGKHND